MIAKLLLEIIELLNQFFGTIIAFIEDELRPLCREFREYLHEKRIGNCPFGESTSEQPEAMPPEHLYNRKEAAAFLLVDPRSVTRYRTSGKLKHVYNENERIRYREEDLQACYFWKWGRWP